jgi:predicted Zn-dependent protease
MRLRALREAELLRDPKARARALEALITEQPGLADARLGLSLAHVELGDIPRARSVLAELLRLWPDNLMALKADPSTYRLLS